MLIGVTGGYACGKTTVSKIIAEKGPVRLDSDAIAKRVLDKKVRFLKKEFPDAFVHGRVSRKHLAGIVFSSPSRRARLEKEVHPAVAEEIKKKSKNKHCVVEVPLLFESGMEKMFDVVIVVTAPLKKRLERAPLSRKEAIKRIRSQMPLSEKKKRADYVIKNDSSMSLLKERVGRVWDDINA